MKRRAAHSCSPSARHRQPSRRAAAYVNYLSEGEQDRVKAAYGAKYAQLVALKTKYDPGNLFGMN
jgi:hypothetical protein